MPKSDPKQDVLKALMHPVRLAILRELGGGEQCVCHLEASLGCRQAYISQHLILLRRAGLIRPRKDGWNVYYRVSGPEVEAAARDILALMGGPEKRPARSAGNHCPCPKCAPAGTGPARSVKAPSKTERIKE